MNTFYFQLTNGRDYAYMESDYDISTNGRGYLLINRKEDHSIFFPYANILIVERKGEKDEIT